jgi:hypothetical protein
MSSLPFLPKTLKGRSFYSPNLNLRIIFDTRIAWVRAMVFNATFNNISAISWQSVLLVEETGVHGENHRPAASH